MGQHHTHSPEETVALGRRLGARLQGGETVAFTGGLGAGKTTFCRGLALGLDSADPVSSPTFALVNLYNGRRMLAHFDAYRITALEDLETAGYYDYLDEGAVVAVEWSENIRPLLEPPLVRVDIRPAGGEVREITIEGIEGL